MFQPEATLLDDDWNAFPSAHPDVWADSAGPPDARGVTILPHYVGLRTDKRRKQGAECLLKEAFGARFAGGPGKRFRMIANELPSFDGPNIAAQLNCMSDGEFDALPFGVVEMDHKFKVLRCNSTQMRLSKLPTDQVIGHSFFRDLAPWGNNRAVAKRYQVDSLEETIPYTVSLNLQPLPVTLRMLKPAYNERMYLLVTWM